MLLEYVWHVYMGFSYYAYAVYGGIKYDIIILLNKLYISLHIHVFLILFSDIVRSICASIIVFLYIISTYTLKKARLE